MDTRRAHLKDLAWRFASYWENAVVPACLSGESRIETRNTVYQLRDGVCYAVVRDVEDGHGNAHASEMTGMRVVGWLPREGPEDLPMHKWEPGLRAVLWRPRTRTERSAIAMTSRSVAFRQVARSVPPPLPKRRTTPPPLPSVMVRSSVLPAAPPSIAPPPPPSTTRVHSPASPVSFPARRLA
jgi:hypothetical protein